MHLSKVGALHCLIRWLPVLGMTTAAPLGAVERTCDGNHVRVLSADQAHHKLICRGAEDAIRFLNSQGLGASNGISIEVVEKMPRHVSTSAIGVNLTAERKILILAYPKFKKQRKWLDVAIDGSLYRSVVSHEVAHAIAADHFTIASPSIQAQEYIAYVTQFSTMQAAQRAKILANNPDHGANGVPQMSATIYLFDPERFGVRAYRHFLGLSNGRAFLHAMLN
jgi:hypothetical protein